MEANAIELGVGRTKYCRNKNQYGFEYAPQEQDLVPALVRPSSRAGALYCSGNAGIDEICKAGIDEICTIWERRMDDTVSIPLRKLRTL